MRSDFSGLPGFILLLGNKKRGPCVPLEWLAPLSLPWPPLSDIPCRKGVRSGCSDCRATGTGAVTEGLKGQDSLTPAVAKWHKASAQLRQMSAAFREVETQCMLNPNVTSSFRARHHWTTELAPCWHSHLISSISLYIAFSKTSFSQTHSSALLTLLSPVLVLELLEFVFPLLLLQLLLVTLLLHLPLVLQQLLLVLECQ